MKSDPNIDDIVKRGLPSAAADEMEADAARVLQRLRSIASQPLDHAEAERFSDLDGSASVPRWRWMVMVGAVAAVLVAAIATTVERRAPRNEDVAGVETIDGSPYLASGKSIRANAGSSSIVALPDGSRVEMDADSELALEHADDGLRIRLRSGSIIVNAAKQRQGHLYVQTKDMTVSVVGTIFLVNAEDAGSRVTVIEGEVRVRAPLKKIETSLRPGQQVSSSPTLSVRSVKEEIAWSRFADAHLAILATFEKGMALTAGPLTPVAPSSRFAQAAAPQAASAAQPQFEEASIRPCDPDNVPAPPAGARGGGVNSFQMTPGRTHALCMTLATLIRTAVGYGPMQLDFLAGSGIGPGRRGLGFNNVYGLGVEDGRRVRGGPDWIRSDRYTIDAVADGAATAEDMRGAMLRALLEKRFQLKAHVETEQVPAFDLTIARSGLKIKPLESGAVDKSSSEQVARGFVNATVSNGGACEPQPTVGRGQPAIIRPAQPGERQPPPPSSPGQPVTILFRNFVDVRRGEKPTCGMSIQRNGPNQIIVAGGTTLEALGRALASPLGGVTVTDKTGNTDKFNVVLEFVRDENTPGPSFLTPDQPEQTSDVPRGQTIFTAIEEQLGLKLEPAKAPREFIVVDRVERPTPN